MMVNNHMIPKPNGESDKRLNMIDVSTKKPKRCWFKAFQDAISMIFTSYFEVFHFSSSIYVGVICASVAWP